MFLVLACVSMAASAQSSVIISEFLAHNTGGLVDEDGDYSDWIELYNGGATAVNLGGWYLTDDAANLTKWAFPSTNIAAKGFMVVFASGKDRRVAGLPLHTSFGLASGGEYLALVMPDGVTIATEFSPMYPEQFADISYGLIQSITTTYFVTSNSAAKVFVPTGPVSGNWT
ncbi:MAG TPA: lamin tail domain-containing protein, partial [Verrucomicrobiae bacterium]|nr:lamin tail domain-containing protein [Verrucomicrobiae bacterium]